MLQDDLTVKEHAIRALIGLRPCKWMDDVKPVELPLKLNVFTPVPVVLYTVMENGRPVDIAAKVLVE